MAQVGFWRTGHVTRCYFERILNIMVINKNAFVYMYVYKREKEDDARSIHSLRPSKIYSVIIVKDQKIRRAPKRIEGRQLYFLASLMLI